MIGEDLEPLNAWQEDLEGRDGKSGITVAMPSYGRLAVDADEEEANQEVGDAMLSTSTSGCQKNAVGR